MIVCVHKFSQIDLMERSLLLGRS